MFVNKLSQSVRVDNSRILKSKNAKLSGYYFGINQNIYRDFQIHISVPLNEFLLVYSMQG